MQRDAHDLLHSMCQRLSAVMYTQTQHVFIHSK